MRNRFFEPRLLNKFAFKVKGVMIADEVGQLLGLCLSKNLREFSLNADFKFINRPSELHM